MRRLFVPLVVTACATALVVTAVRSNMRTWPAAISQTAQAPAHVAAFAEAQCRRDPAGLVANASNLPLDVATSGIAAAARCSGVRYLGSSHDQQAGVLYFFVLTDADDEYEMWWVYTVNDDGLVTGLR